MPLPPGAARVSPGAACARIAGGASVPRLRRVRARGTRAWSAAAPAPGWLGRRGRSRGRRSGGQTAGRGARAAVRRCLASPVRPARGRHRWPRSARSRLRLAQGRLPLGRGRLRRAGLGRAGLGRGRLGQACLRWPGLSRGRRRLSLRCGLVIWPRPRHVPDPHRGIQRDLHPGHRALQHQSSTTTRVRRVSHTFSLLNGVWRHSRGSAARFHCPGRHRSAQAGNVPDPRCADTVRPS
jgi:hypothetical protein